MSKHGMHSSSAKVNFQLKFKISKRSAACRYNQRIFSSLFIYFDLRMKMINVVRTDFLPRCSWVGWELRQFVSNAGGERTSKQFPHYLRASECAQAGISAASSPVNTEQYQQPPTTVKNRFFIDLTRWVYWVLGFLGLNTSCFKKPNMMDFNIFMGFKWLGCVLLDTVHIK